MVNAHALIRWLIHSRDITQNRYIYNLFLFLVFFFAYVRGSARSYLEFRRRAASSDYSPLTSAIFFSFICLFFCVFAPHFNTAQRIFFFRSSAHSLFRASVAVAPKSRTLVMLHKYRTRNSIAKNEHSMAKCREQNKKSRQQFLIWCAGKSMNCSECRMMRQNEYYSRFSFNYSTIDSWNRLQYIQMNDHPNQRAACTKTQTMMRIYSLRISPFRLRGCGRVIGIGSCDVAKTKPGGENMSNEFILFPASLGKVHRVCWIISQKVAYPVATGLTKNSDVT